MPIKKPRPVPKRRPSQRKVRLTVDPSRLALAAVERIKTALTRAGHADRFGEPATMRELVARGGVLGANLPPSYIAAVRVASKIGEPERFLTAKEMGVAVEEMAISHNRLDVETDRFVPFAKVGERYLCFDKKAASAEGEMPVIEWVYSSPRPRHRNFGEWLDAVADAREESLEHAAVIPQRLRTLLVDLGFRFDYPVVGRLETGDIEALEELLGPALTEEVRGQVDRLFDTGGKASLTLNVDEFTLAVSLRTGIYVFEAEDVFRWLRYFRDENFFGDQAKEPSHADNVRDLRRAPREPPLVLRGVSELAVRPAQKHHFRAAAGASADDFYVLGRTGSTSERSPSLLLHVVEGEIEYAHAVDEPLTAVHVTPKGAIWGLSMGGTAFRFAPGEAKTFPLVRPTRGRTWWYGIGGDGERVLVWGAGALLEFDGERFAPFSPDAGLDESESVAALCASKNELAMLVCGDRMGAVARFDGKKWLPIHESHVIDANLADLDVWRGIAVVLARDGRIWRIEDSGPPRAVVWDSGQDAFLNEAGGRRATHGVRAFDGGALLASDGGVIAVGAKQPVFHSAGQTREPARLSRVGGAGGMVLRARTTAQPGQGAGDAGIVATIGSHLWVWRAGAFQIIDVREW
jgi:hypothetical protein